MAAGAYPDADPEEWVVAGVRELGRRRGERGRWKSFPFFYTLLSLVEFGYPQVIEELKYTRPALETVLRRKPLGTHGQRRVDLARQIMVKISG